jgi:uncharacterized protein with PIN domain
MTVREAMDIINGALDSLYEFYDNDADSVFENISKAEAVLEKLVQKEEEKPKNSCARCPECNKELFYDEFELNDDYCDEIVLFEVKGHCPHCQNTYTWKETFELTKIEFDNDNN